MSAIAQPSMLVERIVPTSAAAALRQRAAALPPIVLDSRETANLELIACGAATPLTGFLRSTDYLSVLERMRLSDGTIWPIPMTLAVDAAVARRCAEAGAGSLFDARGRLWGVIRVDEMYLRAPQQEARAIYGTDDPRHPGVRYLLERPTTLIGGPVDVLELPADAPFCERRLTPAALRAAIAERGWRTVAGFLARNPIQRAHEYQTKIALEICDGLVIDPLVGATSEGEVPAAVRVRAYDLLLERYYPRRRTLLSVFPGAPRDAGPRAALFDAVVRKNYGITHLIVDRDDAAIGRCDGPSAAQEIFERFAPEEIGVVALPLAPAFYCHACRSMASERSCPHPAEARLALSGTTVRSRLRNGEPLPSEFMRPEVAAILREHLERPGRVPPPPEASEPRPRTRGRKPESPGAGGTIVWITGLSGAGKSTLAAALEDRLRPVRPVQILDGDDVHDFLSDGLASRNRDADANIARIAFVARLLARHGVTVLVAATSPYCEPRQDARYRAEAEGIRFVEVFLRAPLSVLAARDATGRYQKALRGEIRHVTGISDPYEVPEVPDVIVDTDRVTVADSTDRVLAAIRRAGANERSPLHSRT